MTGYFRVPRGWMDNELFQSPNREPFCHRAAYMWLIERAAYEDGEVSHKNTSHPIKRGQLVASLLDMGGAWGWNTTKVARFLTALHRAGVAVTVTVKKVTVITLCDYDEIQSSPEASVTPRKSERYSRWEVTVTGTKEEKEVNISSEAKASSAPSAREIAEAMADVWRKACGDILAVPAKLDASRITASNARWRDTFDRELSNWAIYCAEIRASPFCCGDNDRVWKADFDWALKPKSIRNVREGKYTSRRRVVTTENPHDAETRAFDFVTRRTERGGPDSPPAAALLDPPTTH